MAVGRYAVRCPACDSTEVVGFADLGQVPVLSGYTWGTAHEAQAAPRGQMRLAYCPTCAHVVNLAFDERVMRYDGSYDNSLHHSPAFTQ